MVLDGRDYWRQEEVEGNGLLYFGIGRSSRAEPGASDRAETVGCRMVVS
jgi:hypothetical protein